MTSTLETPEETLARLQAEPAQRNLLSIPTTDGDLRVMWDPANPAEVKAAKKAFVEAQEKKMIAYTVDPETGERTGEVIREFDPEASKIIMRRQLAGG